LALEAADHVVGPLDKAEADLPVSGASVFIFPSLYQGFGIPPLEAVPHDYRVVCSNTSSIPEVVGDAGEY
jgi:glycosyltransferase involved in cell wall biosynthesis